MNGYPRFGWVDIVRFQHLGDINDSFQLPHSFWVKEGTMLVLPGLSLIHKVVLIMFRIQNTVKIKKDYLLYESHSFCNMQSIIGYISASSS